MKGTIYSISLSPERGTLKKEVRAAMIHPLGIEGDGHSGDWERQITLMNYDDFVSVKHAHKLDLHPGDMAENIIIEGLDFGNISKGSQIRLGKEACLEVSQIGKEDHPSVVTRTFGVSILPYKGLFCKVIKEGWIERGDQVEIIEG